jgi:hypothetical protein
MYLLSMLTSKHVIHLNKDIYNILVIYVELILSRSTERLAQDQCSYPLQPRDSPPLYPGRVCEIDRMLHITRRLGNERTP